MFYEETKVNENLTCQNCHIRFDEKARFLPCGYSICSKCTQSIQINQHRFQCILCDKMHFIDDDGLPINKLISDLLKLCPVEVSRGEKVQNLKDVIKEIENRK